jgi:hypothetical protein
VWLRIAPTNGLRSEVLRPRRELIRKRPWLLPDLRQNVDADLRVDERTVAGNLSLPGAPSS